MMLAPLKEVVDGEQLKPFFGTNAHKLDKTTLKRVLDMAKRAEEENMTLASCTTYALNLAESWMKNSTERSAESGVRCWKTFCSVLKVPVLIHDLPINEREYIGVAFVGYMIKTIKPTRGDKVAAGTIQNYLTHIRNLHRRHHARFDVFKTTEMPTFAFVLKKCLAFLLAHAPPGEAKPLVPLGLFLTMVAMWHTNNPAEAVVAAIIRLATFTGRRMGDFLPQHPADYRACSDLTFKHVIIKVDEIIFTLMDTKNRIGGPAWTGILMKNKHDPSVCPVIAIHDYMKALRTHDGDLSPEAPFFQVFSPRLGRFTKEAYSVSRLSTVVNRALTALDAKQPGQCVHFRVEVANMLSEAGVPKEYHNRFMDWKDKIYEAQHKQARKYSRGLDPILKDIQEVIYKHFADFSSAM
jgi:hypothetical protein